MAYFSAFSAVERFVLLPWVHIALDNHSRPLPGDHFTVLLDAQTIIFGSLFSDSKCKQSILENTLVETRRFIRNVRPNAQLIFQHPNLYENYMNLLLKSSQTNINAFVLLGTIIDVGLRSNRKEIQEIVLKNKVC